MTNGWVGKRKALAKKADDMSLVKHETTIDLWNIKQELMSSVAASNAKNVYNSKTPLLPYGTKINQSKIMFPLCPDHLITLLQYNALRALSVNRTLISGILYTPLECDQEIIHVVPYPSNPASVPAALLPTILHV